MAGFSFVVMVVAMKHTMHRIVVFMCVVIRDVMPPVLCLMMFFLSKGLILELKFDSKSGILSIPYLLRRISFSLVFQLARCIAAMLRCSVIDILHIPQQKTTQQYYCLMLLPLVFRMSALIFEKWFLIAETQSTHNHHSLSKYLAVL